MTDKLTPPPPIVDYIFFAVVILTIFLLAFGMPVLKLIALLKYIFS